MSTKRDYYEVLGVSKNATPDQIKAAYRTLAKKYHPDINKEKSAEGNFKEANEAYEVLFDSQKRQVYDQYGHAGVSGAAGGAGGFSGEGFGDFSDVFGDVFENIFGGTGGSRSGGSSRSRTAQGEDLQVRLTVTLQDALMGVQKTVKINHTKTCLKCTGSGAKPGTNLKTCAQCKGTGSVQFRQGFFSLSQTCNRCGGAGRSIETPCHDCEGRGKIRVTEPITVKIPAGVQEGTALRLSGSGEAGAYGGVPGDLYVVVHFESDPRFERKDDDILIEHKISITQAALGSHVHVLSLEGNVTLKVPPGTQTGTIFRVREKGIPHLSGRGRGDQLIKILVEVPASLTDQQRQLLHQLAQTFGENETGKEEESFIKKVFKK